MLIQAPILLSAGVAEDPKNPHELLQSGISTNVVGILDGDRADHPIRTQAELIRDLPFPEAAILDDTELDEDPTEWAERLALLYAEALPY